MIVYAQNISHNNKETNTHKHQQIDKIIIE